MAQLTDDCFAFSGPLLPIAEAERLINERVVPVAEIETVPLLAARGRVVAREIVAPLSLPPFDNSAVDGYAVRHADLDPAQETHLAIGERVAAGHAATNALAARQCPSAPIPSSCRRTAASMAEP
jgi:molybdopterin molybdotransferase